MSRLLTRAKSRHLARTRTLMTTTSFTPTQLSIRESIFSLCRTKFPNSYWREADQTSSDPTSFHAAIASAGFLGIALPESYGGAGLGISEATMMMQSIAESGAGMAGAQAIHANVYGTQPLLKFASEEMKSEVLPRIVDGSERVCFGVTEPGAGLDTMSLRTTAVRETGEDGEKVYRISGQKVWTTCAHVADRMILLARTSPREAVSKTSAALSLFCIPLDRTQGGLSMRRISKMGGRAVDAAEVFFTDYAVPASCLIGGVEGKGWEIVTHGMNAERCLMAGEALGLGYAALERAATYAREREVFGRPIGKNQGIAHPLAEAWMRLEAAKLATYHAARMYDESTTAESNSEVGQKDVDAPTQKEVGIAANSAKYLAAEAAFAACERAVLTHGGMGYAVEYDVERWFRESLVPRIAPVSREMILNFVGEKVLGLPRSY